MKHEDLKQDDIVIFKKYSNITNKEEFQDDNIIWIDKENKTISICYLEGYKSMNDVIPYNKVVAKYEPNGEYMRFGCYSGNSVLLED